MKNKLQKTSLIISITTFVVFCLIFLFLYREINNNNDKVYSNITKLKIEESSRDNMNSLDNSLKTLAPQRALLETHFAQSSDIVPFLDMIEKLAPTAGATAQVDSVKTLADNSGLAVGLKVSGSFETIYKFLILLENSPYELEFISMDIYKINTDAAINVVNKNVKSIKNSNWEAVFKIQLLSFVE